MHCPAPADAAEHGHIGLEHDFSWPFRPEPFRPTTRRQSPYGHPGLALREVQRKGLPAARRGPGPFYDEAIARLTAEGRTYECFCTRREIQEAASAPHAPQGAYPGTCRRLSHAEREIRRSSRPASIRLQADVVEWAVEDQLCGIYRGMVDDFVLRRNDGVTAYNLAVVVDDAAQGIDQVVRGDDLLPSTPRQAYLATLLGLPVPEYAHVPLVVNHDGARLAKRDGAVTLGDLAAVGIPAGRVRDLILESVGLPAGTLEEALPHFRPRSLPKEPWVWKTPRP